MAEVSKQQMSDAALAEEQVRSRLVAYIGFAAAAAFIASLALYAYAMSGANLRSTASRLTAIHDHATPLIFSSLLNTIALALLALALGHIALAVKARMNNIPKLFVPVAYTGPALAAIATPTLLIAQLVAANKFFDGPRTNEAAKDALDGLFMQIAFGFSLFAVFLLAVAWIGVSAYGMRCGLLTRLVGGVGFAIGVLSILSLGSPAPILYIIEGFWLAAVSVMLLATEGTVPPAWKLGVAVPWREVAAAKQAAADEEQLAELEKSDQPEQPKD